MDSNKVLQQYEKYINPSLVRLFRLMGLNGVEAQASGWVITDTDGTDYIDCLGGYGMFAVGHRHPQVVDAVERQLKAMPMSGKVLFNQPAAELAARLAAIAPGKLQYNFFVNSGTEAVEGCLKIARLATGRTDFVAALNGFHGKTLGSLSVTGRELYRKPFQPLIPGVTHVPYGDIQALEQAVTEKTAAVILEPIQGEGGIIEPPLGYLPAVAELCHQRGALFIADEVQTGIGRTGRWFGVDAENVCPDLMAVAKALGGGVMPVGSVLGTPEAWQGLIENPLLHTSTFGGGQMACAAGVATLQVIEEEDLLRRGTSTGRYFKKGLAELAREFPQVVVQVRGRGMMLGLEVTKEGAGGMLMAGMISRHILIAYTLNNPKVIRFEPPLAMPEKVVDQVLEQLRASLKEVQQVIEEL